MEESVETKANLEHFVKPNVDTLRIMIRAWCRAHMNDDERESNGSAIFKACGYLIQMQNLLEGGKNDFEPLLDDYLTVFQAWGEVT